MADFKIKSAAGTGNKTLLQGQDQTDSAYAIEIGDAGATTLTNATLTAGSLASGVTGGAGLTGSTSLGTVTAGNLSNTAIVYPAGHVIYANTFNFTSTGASSDPGTTWTPTSLTITVPAATVAKLSKIYVSVFNTMAVVLSASAAIASTRIIRTVNSAVVEIARVNMIGTHSPTYPATGTKINASICGMDVSLGSSSYDHIYSVDYRSDHVNYSGSIQYHGYANYTDYPIVNISVLGVV
jgi:hypothetical protein